MFRTKKERDEKLQEWQKAQQNAATWKARETELRNEILKGVYDYNEDDREGTVNEELGGGYLLKANFKLTRKMAKADAVAEVLNKISAMGDEGKFVAPRLVKWEPELSLSEYKKLSPEMRKVVDEVVTSKPSLPSLTIVEPKA